MRVLHFKKEYKIKLTYYGTKITIDPVQRMIEKLKNFTFRFKENPIDDFQIRQGSRYARNTIRKDYFVRIFEVEEVNINEMNPQIIQQDIGLNEKEWNLLIKSYNPNQHFIDEIIKINRMKKEEGIQFKKNPTGFLHSILLLEFNFREFECKDCNKLFQIHISEIDIKRTDICPNCIQNIVDRMVEDNKQKKITSYSSLNDKRILQGF